MCDSKAAELESSRRLKTTEKKKMRIDLDTMPWSARQEPTRETRQQQASNNNNNSKLQQRRRQQAHDAYKFVILDATATFINLKFNLKWSRLSVPQRHQF